METAEVLLATMVRETETGRNKGYKACSVLTGVTSQESLSRMGEQLREVYLESLQCFRDGIVQELSRHEFPPLVANTYLDCGVLPLMVTRMMGWWRELVQDLQERSTKHRWSDSLGGVLVEHHRSKITVLRRNCCLLYTSPSPRDS